MSEFNMFTEADEVLGEASALGFEELVALDLERYAGLLLRYCRPSGEQNDLNPIKRGEHRMTCSGCGHYPMNQRSVVAGTKAMITYTCPKCGHTFEREVSVGKE